MKKGLIQIENWKIREVGKPEYQTLERNPVKYVRTKQSEVRYEELLTGGHSRLKNVALKQQEDAIRNIAGEFAPHPSHGIVGPAGITTGVFAQGNPLKMGLQRTSAIINMSSLFFDASLAVPTADENRPKSAVVMYCIKIVNDVESNNNVTLENIREFTGTRLWRSDLDGGFDLPPVAGTATSISHSLPIDPFNCRCDVQLLCVSADAGYSIGDSIKCASTTTSTLTYTLPLIATLSADNIRVMAGTGNSGIIIQHKTTGTMAFINSTSWRYIFRIWY